MAEEEDLNKEIYYQINTNADIQTDNLKNIRNNPYYLIELKITNKNDFTLETIKDSLISDGVDISKINDYKYFIGEKTNDESNYVRSLYEDKNISEIKDSKKIYLHLIIEEEQNTEEQKINKEMDKYNLEIENSKKNINEIAMTIKKEEIFNNKILSDILYEKNKDIKMLDNVNKESESMINNSKKSLIPISNNSSIFEKDTYSLEEIVGINDNFSENDDYDNNNNINKNLKIEKYNKNLSNKIESKIDIKEEITLCYLFSNPLINKENTNKEYINNDCFNEIISIYKIFEKSNISANLKFEPINNNFNIYLESSPDILHINVNSTNNNFNIHLDNFGILEHYKCEDLKETINAIKYELLQIKLLILETQNIIDMKKIFDTIGIKNIIYIENEITFPEPNKDVEKFIQELYENLIIRKQSIKKSFIISKKKINNQKIVEFSWKKEKKKKKKEKEEDYIINPKGNEEENYAKFKSQNIISEVRDIKNLKLNDNCFLNLNYNYKRIIGRNVELNNCIHKMKRYNNVCVCGFPGVGKKSFIQNVGKYAFERNMYKKVYYFELYYLRNADEILNNKKNELKNNMKILAQNEVEEKNILLIINLDYTIFDENDVYTMEELINQIKDDNFNYLFAFTINYDIPFKKIKKQLRTPLIKLDALENTKAQNLFHFLTYNLKWQFTESVDRSLQDDNKKFIKKLGKKLIDKTNKYPNDIYLRILFLNCFGEKINEKDINNEFIFNELIKKYKNKMIKILSIFTILKLGLEDILLPIFFSEEEIDFIKKEMKYLIFEEKGKNRNNFYIDNSYKDLIQNILKVKYYKEFLENLNFILKKYSIIFRYLVDNGNYPYNVCFEFHAGIKKGFWLSVNESNINDKFFKEFNNFLNELNINKKFFKEFNNYIKNNKYLDVEKFFINILIIFIDDYYIEMIKGNILSFKEYISQISICLPTLLHFHNCLIYKKRICELFKERLGYLNMNRSRLRLTMFMYWFSDDSNIAPRDSDLTSNLVKDNDNNEIEDNEFNINLKEEFNLIKIYYLIQNKDKENHDINYNFSEYEKNFKNKFNLAKLNLLYGILLNDAKKEQYFDNAYNLYASGEKNIYIETLSLIMKAEYYLSINEFDKSNILIVKCQNIIKSKGAKLKNTDIIYKKDKLIKEKNDKYKKYIKNKLFFFTSNPFFDRKGNDLKIESNNSFYLKYKLIENLPKNMTIDFKNINENFLNDLKKCLSNPINFLYIGCDYYNEEGNLFYTKDTKGKIDENEFFKSILIQSSKLEEIIKNANNKCKIVILGFLNSEQILKYFSSKEFPYIIYFKKSKDLNGFFKKYPYYYFYFQRCFYHFVYNFIFNLCKSCNKIKNSFKEAINASEKKFFKLLDYIENEEEKGEISKINLSQILNLKDNEEDEFFFDKFEDINNPNFNNSSNNLNLINIDSRNSISNKFTNNSYKKKSLYLKEDENEENKKIRKEKESILEFVHFPKGDLNNELFEKLYHNRMYGMKKILSNLINKILKDKLIILYGDSFSGRTRICLELCKYFYMNDYFKEGIFYINYNKIKKIKDRKELKGLNKIKNGNNVTKDALLVFDDLNEKTKNFYSYINNLNTYIIIVIDNKKKFLKDWNNYINEISKGNDKYQNIIKNNVFVNLNISLRVKDAKEFIKYNNIIYNIKERKSDYYFNDKIYIKDIYQKIKNKIDEKNK